MSSPAAVRVRNNLNAANSREGRGIAKRKSLDAPDGTKWCPACEKYIKVGQFSRYSSGNPQAYCKSCYSSVLHARGVSRRFGISSEQYADIMESQGGGCAICGSVPRRQRLAVDHDHNTGFVRGLLCKQCNKNVLGGARDDVEILRRAVAYLDSPPAFDIIGEVVAPNPTGAKRKE